MFWRGVFGYLPANIVQGVVGFLTIIIFTRLLSPEDFGRYALAYSVLTLAHVATFSWLEASMARFWAAQSDEAQMAGHFASLYRAAFLITAVFTPVAGLAVWLWPMPDNFRLPLAVALAGMLLAPLAALPFVLPAELREARRGRLDRERLKAYAVYGYPIAVGLGLTVVLASTDRFLLALFMNEAAVGAYHAAYSIANRTLDVMFVWLGAAGAPALVMALERGGREDLQTAAREQASTLVLIGLPAAVGVALVARPLAEFMIGEDLRTVAASVTPWVALGAFFSGMTTYYFGQAFTLGRRTGWLLLAMSIPAGSNIVLNVLLIPRFGVMGAAWATAISFALGLAASMTIGRRILPLPVPWNALARCGLAAAVMAGAVMMLPSIGGFAELMLDAGVGVIVYGVIAYALNAAGVRDLSVRLKAFLRARRQAA